MSQSQISSSRLTPSVRLAVKPQDESLNGQQKTDAGQTKEAGATDGKMSESLSDLGFDVSSPEAFRRSLKAFVDSGGIYKDLMLGANQAEKTWSQFQGAPGQASQDGTAGQESLPSMRAGDLQNAAQHAAVRQKEGRPPVDGRYVQGPPAEAVRAQEANLERGHKGNAVADTQNLLNQAGAGLVQDGLYGPRTQSAVRQYQQSRGLTPANGIVDAETLSALREQRPASHPEQDFSSTAPNGNVGPQPGASAALPAAGQDMDAQYDSYQKIIEDNGGTFNTEPGAVNLLSFRRETNVYDNEGAQAYDDVTMMIRINPETGEKEVKEYKSNTEPQGRYEGQYGVDANGDGRKDLGRIPYGHYEYETSSSSAHGNRVLRSTHDINADRDTNHDGNFDSSDGPGASAGTSMLFHAGGNNTTGSAGCQTMPPEEYNRFWQDLNAHGNPGKIGYTIVQLDDA